MFNTRVFGKTPFLTFLSSKRLENKYATLKLAVESEFEENFELSPEIDFFAFSSRAIILS